LKRGSFWDWKPFTAITLLAFGAFLTIDQTGVRWLILLLYAVLALHGIVSSKVRTNEAHDLMTAAIDAATVIACALLVAAIVWQLLTDTAWALVGIAMIGLLSSATVIYRFFVLREKGVRRRPGKAFWTILACFMVLAGVASVVSVAAALKSPEGQFETPLLVGFSASLVEDLVFFSLLGLFVVLMQRREADLSRTMDDRIEILFNAKILRSGEAAYLREQVRTISNDCRESYTFVDVIDYDEDNGLVQIDVSRQFYVSNYLTDESSRYELKLDIAADDVVPHDPAITVFPTLSRQVRRERGEWVEDGGGAQPLDPGGTVPQGGVYSKGRKFINIPAHKTLEFRTRFRGWQPLSLIDAATGTAVDEFYQVEHAKHWDRIEVEVRNSLQQKLAVTIKGGDIREFSLLEGHDSAFTMENLPSKSTIAFRFVPL